MALTRRGQHAAFEALVARYQSRLLAFCRHMLASREDAEDVLQEVFAAAFNALQGDDRAIAVRPWLYRIARNRSLNHLRRAQAIGTDSMDVHLSEHGLTTADQVHRREDFRLLVADVKGLPETQRTALLLREMESLSYEQIAAAMETTVPGVKSLLVRARVSLAEAAQARQLSCAEVRLELGEVAEGLRRAGPPVRRHLKACDRCAAFKVELKRTTRALAAVYPIGPLLLVKKLLLVHIGTSAASAGSGAASAGSAVAGAGAGAGSVGGLASAGAVAVAGKAAAGLAAAALVTAGAVTLDHQSPRRPSPHVTAVAPAPPPVVEHDIRPTPPVAAAPATPPARHAPPRRPAAVRPKRQPPAPPAAKPPATPKPPAATKPTAPAAPAPTPAPPKPAPGDRTASGTEFASNQPPPQGTENGSNDFVLPPSPDAQPAPSGTAGSTGSGSTGSGTGTTGSGTGTTGSGTGTTGSSPGSTGSTGGSQGSSPPPTRRPRWRRHRHLPSRPVTGSGGSSGGGAGSPPPPAP